MAILTTQTDLLSANKGGSKRKLRIKLNLDTKRMIRREFDKAVFDHEALAAIEIAREYGYGDLADEMKSDFESLIDSKEAA